MTILRPHVQGVLKVVGLRLANPGLDRDYVFRFSELMTDCVKAAEFLKLLAL